MTRYEPAFFSDQNQSHDLYFEMKWQEVIKENKTKVQQRIINQQLFKWLLEFFQENV